MLGGGTEVVEVGATDDDAVTEAVVVDVAVPDPDPDACGPVSSPATPPSADDESSAAAVLVSPPDCTCPDPGSCAVVGSSVPAAGTAATGCSCTAGGAGFFPPSPSPVAMNKIPQLSRRMTTTDPSSIVTVTVCALFPPPMVEVDMDDPGLDPPPATLFIGGGASVGGACEGPSSEPAEVDGVVAGGSKTGGNKLAATAHCRRMTAMGMVLPVEWARSSPFGLDRARMRIGVGELSWCVLRKAVILSKRKSVGGGGGVGWRACWWWVVVRDAIFFVVFIGSLGEVINIDLVMRTLNGIDFVGGGVGEVDRARGRQSLRRCFVRPRGAPSCDTHEQACGRASRSLFRRKKIKERGIQLTSAAAVL